MLEWNLEANGGIYATLQKIMKLNTKLKRAEKEGVSVDLPEREPEPELETKTIEKEPDIDVRLLGAINDELGNLKSKERKQLRFDNDSVDKFRGMLAKRFPRALRSRMINNTVKTVMDSIDIDGYEPSQKQYESSRRMKDIPGHFDTGNSRQYEKEVRKIAESKHEHSNGSHSEAFEIVGECEAFENAEENAEENAVHSDSDEDMTESDDEIQKRLKESVAKLKHLEQNISKIVKKAKPSAFCDGEAEMKAEIDRAALESSIKKRKAQSKAKPKEVEKAEKAADLALVRKILGSSDDEECSPSPSADALVDKLLNDEIHEKAKAQMQHGDIGAVMKRKIEQQEKLYTEQECDELQEKLNRYGLMVDMVADIAENRQINSKRERYVEYARLVKSATKSKVYPEIALLALKAPEIMKGMLEKIYQRDRKAIRDEIRVK
jgi:hypothetical protein